MHLLLRLIGLLLLIFHFSDARASYYISRPSNIYSGINTTLTVHWFGNNSEINVTAGIIDQGVTIAETTQVFENDSIGILSLPAITLNYSSYYYGYNIFVNGSGGNESIFSNTFFVFPTEKPTYTFVETDKRNYRPLETVKIRVITVYRDLKPYKRPISITIRDSNSNVVKQLLNQKTELGVFSTEVLLPVLPVPGSLYINAGPNGYEAYEYVYIHENESPNFDVTIVAPSYYYKPGKKDFFGKVFANYSYGRPVKGNVTLSLSFTDFGVSYYYPRDDLTGVNKTFEIYGSANFSFSNNEVLKCPFWGRLILTASVTEEKTDLRYDDRNYRKICYLENTKYREFCITGKTVTTSWYIKKATSEYRMFVVGQPGNWTHKDNFTAMIQIQRTDDLPLTQEEKNIPVLIKVTPNYYYYYNYIDVTRNYTMSESGIITIEIPYQNQYYYNYYYYYYYYYFSIEGNYKGSTQSWNMYTPNTWYWNPSIYFKIPDRPVQVGIPFTISLGIIPEVEYIYYTVMAGGVFVATGKSSSSSFTLTAENSWFPIAQVNVYYINPNNFYWYDIISATKTIRINSNRVALSWSTNKTEPSENVTLTISNIRDTPAIVDVKVVDINDILSGNTNTLAAKVDNIYSWVDNIYSWDYLNQYSDGSFTSAYSDYTPVINSPYENNDPITQPVNAIKWFSETIIWKQSNISSGSSTSLQVTVPHKVISWVASAFVMSEEFGLAVSEQYPELDVSKSLFLTLNAPKTVIRGEEFILKVTLENFIASDLQVAVILDPSSSFEIIVPDNNINSVAGQRSVFIPSKETNEVLFPINPKKLGEISLTVQANSLGAFDSATHKVLVKAEGIEYTYSSSVILKAGDVGKKLSFTFPADVVVDTRQASITVVGNFLAPSIKGLQSLIQLPTGCGEQNMIYFAPDIYILQYLIATNQITEDVRVKTIHFIEIGYQTEMNYWRYDGSFSAFGNRDYSGSAWLSAFVLRCFLQARQLISISEDVLYRTTEWLFQKLNEETGIFQEPGRVIHTSLQGGSDGEIARTAYILISLLEDESNITISYRLNKTIQYLENKTEEGIANNHTLSIVAYALSVANSSKAAAALTQLNSRANSVGGQMYWSSGTVISNYWQPPSADIETAAYALLSHCQQNRIAEGVPIMNWLVEQRNHLGGYSSTQDTVMALQALTKFMTLVPSSNNTSLTVSVTDSGAIVANTFHITNNTALVVQSQQIYALDPLELILSAAGEGVALLQLNVIYNSIASSRRKRATAASEVFKLSATVDDSDSQNRISVNVCSSYQGPANETGMVIWEVTLLSGFKLDSGSIILYAPLRLVETKDNKVFLYFDSMNRNEICVAVPMVRTSMVVHSQAATIKIYDYYNPEIHTIKLYNSGKLSKATVCEHCGLNCNNCISNVKMPSVATPTSTSKETTTAKIADSSATAPKLAMLWFCVCCMWNFL